jgi:hypothetical protein
VKFFYAEFNTLFWKSTCGNWRSRWKIRIFMWFLYKKVLLTKDNLTKHNWVGCKKCELCDSKKLIEHLFIRCNFAKLLWQVVHFTFNMPPPTNIKSMFGHWLNRIKMTKARQACVH